MHTERRHGLRETGGARNGAQQAGKTAMARRLGADLTALLIATGMLIAPLTTSLSIPARGDGSHGVIQDYLEDVVAGGVPGISVAVIHDGRTVDVAAAGQDGNGHPMTEHTPMRIESLSKSFTALAVMQLVDAGKIDLEAPVRTYLPAFTLDDPRADRISVAQVLDQTSGMTDATGPPLYRRGPQTLEESVARLHVAHLASDPGTVSAYHNLNYHVAARIVEKVSGVAFGQYLTRHVLTPAGMNETRDVQLSTQQVPGIAQGHVLAYAHAFTADGPTYFVEGSGGIVSTASDMATWLRLQTQQGRAADGTRVVSAAAIRTMHTPRSAATDDYGFGWYNAESAEGPPRRISHSGAGAGFSAYQGIFPNAGYAIALMINTGAGLTSPDPGVLAQNLLHVIDPQIPTLKSGDDHGRTDWILTALAIVTVGLAVLGICRSRRWARRRQSRGIVVTVLRLLPALIPIGWFAALPSLQLLATGRVAPYRLLFSVSPVGLCWFATWAAACAVLILARVGWLFRLRGRVNSADASG